MYADVRYIHAEELDRPARRAHIPGLLIQAPGKLVAIVLDGNRYRTLKFPETRILQFDKILYEGQPYPLDRYWDTISKSSETYPATKDAREWLLKVDPIKAREVRVELDPDKPGGRGATIAELCDELRIDPKKTRKFLRSKGLNAPYSDFNAIWKLLKGQEPKLRKATSLG
jgi:hypothetical protein